MKKPLLHTLSPLIGLALFAVALWTLHRNLAHHNFRDVIAQFKEIPLPRIAIAFALTVAGYFLLSCYDWLAFLFLGRPEPLPRIALVGFISYSLSNNFGNALITGGSVRYRIYSSWGLTAFDVTRVILFCTVTFFSGMFAMAGLVFLFQPLDIPPSLSFLPIHSLKPVGLLFLAIVALYLAMSFQRRSLNIREMILELPRPKLAFAQIAVSSLELVCASGVLYCLLPSAPGLSYFEVLGVYMLALIAGLASQVPGGLGVFESIVLVELSDNYPTDVIFGALLAYRTIYYLIPLGAGMLTLLAQELRGHVHKLEPVARILGRTVNMLVPNVLAFLTFLSGAMLLFTGATPVLPDRLRLLRDWLPLSPLYLLNASHFFASLAGTGLLLLGRGLQRRSDAAWNVAVALLGMGAAFCLLRGLDYEEAAVLAILMLLMIACRGRFYRRASFFSERFTPGWIAAIAIVLMTTFWIGRMAYKNVDFTQDIWWRFAIVRGDAPRHVRAAVGILVALSCVAIARLLRPASPDPSAPGAEDMARVEAIVRKSTNSHSWLAALGDKSILYDESGSAFIMYGIESRSWIAMGDPVAPPGRPDLAPELIWDFRELCDRHGGWPVFYQVSAANLPHYLDLGLTPLKIGEEGRVPLEKFSLAGGKNKNLRAAINRMEKEGCAFEVVPPEQVAPLLPDMRAISDAWLAEKHVREKGFSLGNFNETYLQRFPVAVIRRGGRIEAFANLWLGADHEEISIDLMRHLPDAFSGVMDGLFVQIMLWGREQGFEHFNMGMAPLSGLENRALAPLWTKIGSAIFRHGEHFYNFQGLRNFKEKYNPVWQPKYVVSPAGLALPRILLNVSALISGGKRAIIK